jgi:hypothetical protein
MPRLELKLKRWQRTKSKKYQAITKLVKKAGAYMRH